LDLARRKTRLGKENQINGRIGAFDVVELTL
jgi:hypothetical protein